MSTEATGAAAPGTHYNHDHNHDNPNLDIHDHDHDNSTIAVVNPQSTHKSPKPTGLHSPPDSNNVDASDSDSELSDLDEAIADADSPGATTAPAFETATRNDKHRDNKHDDDDDVSAHAAGNEAKGPDQAPTPGQDDQDIGEVLPDHWSGAIPIFKPTLHQFKDFRKFVCYSIPTIQYFTSCCPVARSRISIPRIL